LIMSEASIISRWADAVAIDSVICNNNYSIYKGLMGPVLLIFQIGYQEERL
jgi:hypothetical protein